MIMTNKLIPVALVAALIGGSVGAFVMHTKNQTAEPQTTASTLPTTDAQNAQYTPALGNASGNAQFIPAEFNSAPEQSAYKTGFADGFRGCETGSAGSSVSTSNLRYGETPVASQNAVRSSAVTSQSSQRVYSAYQRPQGRSFWQKHRDKLTVGMGTGGGALIGGLIGGKKGAAIGGLSGAGGSALYTYKIRKRNRRY